MRTYQKHVGLSMMSFLSCVSLPVPCQALGTEKKFPATLRSFTAKPLILLNIAPELRKSSRYFPAGRESCDARTRLGAGPAVAQSPIPVRSCRSSPKPAGMPPVDTSPGEPIAAKRIVDQLVGDDAGVVPAVSDAAERRFAEYPRVADAEPHGVRPVWIEVIGAVAHAATIMPCRRQRQNRAALTPKPRRPQAARMPQAQNAR